MEEVFKMYAMSVAEPGEPNELDADHDEFDDEDEEACSLLPMTMKIRWKKLWS